MEDAEYALMDGAEQRMWWYRALHIRLIAALAGVRGPVLDAGCGTGGLLARLRGRPEIAPFGVEFHEAAARRAAAKAGVPVACGSVNALPFATGAFAAALSADVLCHAAVQPDAALAELRRVLRPGGLLVVNMPAFMWLLSAHDRRVRNARRVTAAALRAALAGAGFRVRRATYWNSLLLPLMVLRRKLPARSDAASDVTLPPAWLNRALFAVTALERHLPPLPAGGSVLAIAERT